MMTRPDIPADSPMVMVPHEPTEAMIEAAERAGTSVAGSDLSSGEMTRHIWSAMLSASPVGEGEPHVAQFDDSGMCQCPHHSTTSTAEQADYYPSHEALHDLMALLSEHDVLNGGGPDWAKRWRAALLRAEEILRDDA